jgi:hypothetical protein
MSEGPKKMEDVNGNLGPNMQLPVIGSSEHLLLIGRKRA